MDRCRLVLKAFIFEGEVQAENVRERVATARKKLDKLAKQPEQLAMSLQKKINSKVLKATKGKLMVHCILESLCIKAPHQALYHL